MVLATLMSAVAVVNIRLLATRAGWVSHTDDVLLELTRLLGRLAEAESAQRGYLLTGDAAYLGRYRGAPDSVEARLTALRVLTRDNAAQQAALDTLTPLVHAELAELAVGVDAASSAGLDSARATLRTGRGRIPTEQSRAVLSAMIVHERGRLGSRVARQQRQAMKSVRELAVLLGLTLLLGALGAWVIARDHAAREVAGAEGERLRQQAEAAAGLAQEEAARAREEAARAEDEAARAEDETVRAETEAAHAKEAQAARDHVEAMLDSISDGFLAVDGPGTITFANARGAALLQCTVERLVGRPFAAALPAGVGPAFATYVARARDGRDIVRTDEFFPALDRWLQVNAYPSADGVSLFFQDVSERHAAQASLAASEERLRLALDAGRVGAWDWNLTTNRLAGSERFIDALGVPGHGPDWHIDDFWRALHPDDEARVADSIRHSVESDVAFAVEFRVVRPNGSIRWIGAAGIAHRDDDGVPLRIVGTAVDVTDRRESEVRLRQVQRMEAIGRLAGGVAHEVNNQMSVVLGFADFVLNAPGLTEAVRDDVRQIRRAGQRSAAVTSQLLAFSRRQMLQPTVLDPNAVIGGFGRVLQHTLGELCTLNLLLDPAVGAIRADQGQLEQVLLNLTLNACDAMAGDGRMTIETSEVTLADGYAVRRPTVAIRAGRYVMIAVSDTGSGMAPDTLAHVFEPFFTTKSVGRGTGLGLSSVYGIIKQSDGYIWAYSEVGLGSTFKLYLPLADAAAALAPAAPRARERVSGTVLVVEDEAAVRAMVVRALTEEGFDVLEAENGQDALALLARDDRPLSLVLTDVVMPLMGGRELAAELRERRSSLPVLFMSGYTDADVVSRGLLDDDQPFIQKPFSPDALAQRVRALLGLQRADAAG